MRIKKEKTSNINLNVDFKIIQSYLEDSLDEYKSEGYVSMRKVSDYPNEEERRKDCLREYTFSRKPKDFENNPFIFRNFLFSSEGKMLPEKDLIDSRMSDHLLMNNVNFSAVVQKSND